MVRLIYAIVALCLLAVCLGQAQTAAQDQDGRYGLATFELGVIAYLEGDYEAALEKFTYGCDLDHGPSCENVGLMYSKEEYGLVDEAAARQAFSTACDLSEHKSCQRLGAYAANGLGGDVDMPLARASFLKACELEPSEACLSTAHMQMSGLGGSEDYPGAQENLQRACDADFGKACYQLSTLYMDGPENWRDDVAARNALTQTCDAGFIDACPLLGYFLATGRGGSTDGEAAIPLLKPACASDNVEACALLGVLQIDIDDESAQANFANACRLGHARGCYEYGRYIEADPITAIIAREVHKDSCDGNYAKGCAAYADLLSQGIGGDKDPDLAMVYHRRACDAGHGLSCDLLGFAALGELERMLKGQNGADVSDDD